MPRPPLLHAQQQPVYHQVRVTPDRAGEMGVVGEAQPVVADVLRAVFSLGHRSQTVHPDHADQGVIVQGTQELVQLPGTDRLQRCVAEGKRDVESLQEGPEILQFLGVRSGVNAVDKGVDTGAPLPVGDLRDRPVGRQHALLYQVIGGRELLRVDVHGLPLGVQLDLVLRHLQVQPSLAEALSPHGHGQSAKVVQKQLQAVLS